MSGYAGWKVLGTLPSLLALIGGLAVRAGAEDVGGGVGVSQGKEGRGEGRGLAVRETGVGLRRKGRGRGRTDVQVVG